MPNTETSPRRRWLQFGVRTLLVATVVLAVGLGYWRHRAAELRKTVAALDALEVGVYWSDSSAASVIEGGGFPSSPGRPPGLAGLLGPEYLDSPTFVVFGDEAPIKKVLPHLKALPKLQKVYISGNRGIATSAFRELPGVELFAIRHGRCGDRFVEPL